MMNTKKLFTYLIGTLLLAACAPATPIVPTPDVNVIRTSAAYTVVAEFTLTAAAFSPTPMPPTDTATPEPPTETPTDAFTNDPTLAALGTPVALCDDYSFDPNTLDVTIPDNTVMTPGQDFVKTWRIKNTGICPWGDGYKLIYSYGEKMSGKPVPFTAVIGPGEEVDASINLKAPTKPGTYKGYWQMVSAKGIPFGTKDHILTVVIVVQ